MPLAPGSRLGPYEVLSAIGAGGMGEVYRARDTKLNRDVALKILPEAFALDPDRLARFTREAHVLASLNHPNVAAIYGLEESGGVRALVLELVDGPTLADRIAQGAIPVEETLPIARQIAVALETAHDQGIVHRDLKPANIKLRPDGTVKVLDFGLAKALEPPLAGGIDATISPTITSPAMTRLGVILGTAAYMSPEQAKGREADKRSDIWAFGCVLYEMLTGKRAFDGEDVSDTLANVLKSAPVWSALPAATSAAIHRLLRRSLDKDRARRLHDIADARLEIDDVLANFVDGPTPVRETRADRRIYARVLPWAVAGALGGGVAIGLWAPWRTAPPVSATRLETTLGADVSLSGLDTGSAIALSPDGRTLAFAAQANGAAASQLYVRRLDQLQATALAGTDGAFGPFFSPDGQWVAFFATGKLKKVAAAGGAVVTLCDAPNGRGGSWAEDGTITFRPVNTNADGGMLLRVSSNGGNPERAISLAEGESNLRFPQVLPGGKAVLFYSLPSPGDFSNARVTVQPLPTGPRKALVQRGYYGRYLPSGHILFVREGALFAAPFDVERLELTGPPVPVLEGITTSIATGVAQFAFSSSGTFAYVPGQAVGSTPEPIVWLDRTGKTSPLRAQRSNWSNPRFSPDGRRLALDIDDGKQTDVWVYEWQRDTLSRLTFDAGIDWGPVWTPDARRIAFASNRGDTGGFHLYWQRSDGSGEVERLVEGTNNQIPASWHPTGRFLAYIQTSRAQTSQTPAIMILPMEGDEASGWKPGKPTVFLDTPAAEYQPTFSPDGKWLAYTSNESGQNEVYVRPFPGPGGKWQISTDGGRDPAWSRTRPELFYVREGTAVLTSPIGLPPAQSGERTIMLQHTPAKVIRFERKGRSKYLIRR